MTPTAPATVRAALTDALEGRRLLDHPFYRRWSRGELGLGELAAYAGQYRHLEAALPGWLTAVAGSDDDGAVAQSARRNLADETGEPSHIALFDDFAAAVGAGDAEPMPATQALLDLHTALIATSASAGLCAIATYELQAPAIASSKAEGLRGHHGLEGAAVAFWDVHAAVEEAHLDWSVDALAAGAASLDTLRDAARSAADGWWAFLDEREAARPPAVAVG